jgi:hypothetical protein
VPNIITVIKAGRMRWAGHVAHMRDEKCIQNVEKLKGKGPHGRPRCRRKDNIKMDVK